MSMKSGPARRRASLVLAATLALCTLAGANAAMAQERLLETGSSLLYPLFNLWVPVYAKTHRGVQITTQSTGSHRSGHAGVLRHDDPRGGGLSGAL